MLFGSRNPGRTSRTKPGKHAAPSTMWDTPRAFLNAYPRATAASVLASSAVVGLTLSAPANALLPEGTPNVAAPLVPGASLSDDVVGRMGAWAKAPTKDLTKKERASAAKALKSGRKNSERRILADAYRAAARKQSGSCNMDPYILAGVAQVESRNAAGYQINKHVVTPGIYGPALDGDGVALIKDTDNGKLDKNKKLDRAVGPFQFIPQTWSSFARDGDGDGKTNPQNVFDASLTAATYLCHGDRDLSTDKDLTAALFSYNRSSSYGAAVKSWIDYFRKNGLGAIPNSGTNFSLDRKPGEVKVGEADVPNRAGLFIKPVDAPATSPFGMRLHPVLGYYRMHTGVDFGAPCGRQVVSVADGEVTFAGAFGGYGNRVVIKHADINGHETTTTYNHLESYGVRVGDKVKQNQVIAQVGTTGLSTGCHLHFEVTKDGAYVDPMPYLTGKPSTAVLSAPRGQRSSAAASTKPKESHNGSTPSKAPKGSESNKAKGKPKAASKTKPSSKPKGTSKPTVKPSPTTPPPTTPSPSPTSPSPSKPNPSPTSPSPTSPSPTTPTPSPSSTSTPSPAASATTLDRQASPASPPASN